MSEHRFAAVMSSRAEAPDSLDFFPTPPWATRALIGHVLEDELGLALSTRSVWEPAAGEGHMVAPLTEAFARVHASDIHDHGRGYAVGDFTATLDPARCPFVPDWIITNPPFNAAEAFLARALAEARVGVALLVRTAWLESAGRYASIFRPHPPLVIAQFVERVPMHRGRWEPEGSTTTAYAWVVWPRLGLGAETRFCWIPPGCRTALTTPEDLRRFGPGAGLAADAGPLFSGEGA